MRILVTGAAGQVGREAARQWTASGDDVVALDRAALDVGDRDAVHAAVLGARPDAVVHAAAWTAVDACEAAPERALRDNALACRHVAEACRRAGAHLVALSTDYVFDGTKPDPYHEWDPTGPALVYGRSKLGGEDEIRALLPEATIVRTSWVAGAGGHNIVATVLGRLDSDPRATFAFVDDQRGNPTFTADLVPVLRYLAAARLPGCHHATNAGTTTWFGFVEELLRSAGASPDQVRPIATADLDPPRPAPRPANSALDNLALRLAGRPPAPPWQEGLDRLVKELRT